MTLSRFLLFPEDRAFLPRGFSIATDSFVINVSRIFFGLAI